jgi:hypothetical protein
MTVANPEICASHINKHVNMMSHENQDTTVSHQNQNTTEQQREEMIRIWDIKEGSGAG